MLNWLARYAAVNAELALDGHGALRESVLDVGCGPHGLSIIAPDATFAGVDVSFATPVAAGMVAFRNSPGPLPFEDHAFDTVVCLDVLEHVPPDDRAAFVAELARVCARRVLLACPSDEGAWVEQILRDAYATDGSPIPAWLSEHDEHGLPAADDISRWCAGLTSFRSRELPMVNGLLSGMSVIADMLPALAGRAAEEWREHRTEWLQLFTAGRFGSCFRKGYAIERLAPGDALVDARRFEATVWGAVRCPACARPAMHAREGTIVCEACGHRATLDSSGAWDLPASTSGRGQGEGDGRPAPPEPAHVPVPAAVPATARAERGPRLERDHQPAAKLILAPAEWARPLRWLPALSEYIARVGPERGVTLYLDGRGADVDATTLRVLVQRACEYLSDGAGFSPVVLLEGTVEAPADAHPLGGARDELIDLLGLEPASTPEDAAAIARHAVWAKTLADDLQAVIDAARYHAAPRVGTLGDPLVTVRIPTYGAIDDLIGRAIPSVLGGGYPNVEILVCSDGPQPHARAAVASVGDSRVRYLEIERRPVYPSWPESFWRSAGTAAANRSLDEARGSFIAPLDHDDAFTHDHIPRLLEALRHQDGDFVYGQAMTEWPAGDWRLHGSAPMVYGEVIHAAVMYSARLSHMRYDPDAWLLDEPGDWNLWRRMREAGAVMTHLAEPVALHFKERSSIDHREERDAGPETIATDVLATSARELLQVRPRTTHTAPSATNSRSPASTS